MYSTLQRTTDDLILSVDNTVLSSIRIKDRLIEAFKELDPGEKLFNFELNGVTPNKANSGDS